MAQFPEKTKPFEQFNEKYCSYNSRIFPFSPDEFGVDLLQLAVRLWGSQGHVEESCIADDLPPHRFLGNLSDLRQQGSTGVFGVGESVLLLSRVCTVFFHVVIFISWSLSIIWLIFIKYLLYQRHQHSRDCRWLKKLEVLASFSSRSDSTCDITILIHRFNKGIIIYKIQGKHGHQGWQIFPQITSGNTQKQTQVYVLRGKAEITVDIRKFIKKGRSIRGRVQDILPGHMIYPIHHFLLVPPFFGPS